MIIKGIEVKKFRGFNDVKFELGKHITVIAGQNGTQKTTLLGMISQPFTITDEENPMYGEKPLSGGNFKSSFSEKFKLSDDFDIPKSHEWTLKFVDQDEPNFTVESIKKGKPYTTGVRFWKKNDRTKGAGYIQLPVIYLSLSRLFPIGEDESLETNRDISLTDVEFEFYRDWHNKILIIPDVELTSVDYLVSKQKHTLGANTSYYDWRMNSSGQDNIGKILLAIISFKRLKERHETDYKGGILAIDELDATLYPGSQIKLIEALRKFSSKYNIQIVFTTHSLSILEKVCDLQVDKKLINQVNVIYLEKIDSEVIAIQNIDFENIKDKLNVSISPSSSKRKVVVFTEDQEGEIFAKCILKTKRTTNLEFAGGSLGCGNLLELSRKEIKGFRIQDSIIILDGDVSSKKSNKNILILPGNKPPEKLLADFLYNLQDRSTAWEKIHKGYTKQIVFRDYQYHSIISDRNIAKKWFNQQKEYWGRGAAKLINLWIEENSEIVEVFCKTFDDLFKKYK